MTASKQDASDRQGSSRSLIKSGERIVRIFDLFAAERPTITAGYVAQRLQITPSTAYRYLALLSRAGLVEHVAGAGYSLGPAITEFDRQIRLSDRYLRESRASMRWLLENVHCGAAVLCRRFRDQVMCVHREQDSRFAGRSSYERGRIMPMFLGAASKVILGHLPRPTARAFYADPKSRIGIREGGLGSTCQEYRANLHEMRREGICITRGDLDAGQVIVAGAIFDRSRRVVGSIALVLDEAATSAKQTARVGALVNRAAAEITAGLADRP
jgi:DNA-binding IclR family transcriptional regulator